MKRVHYIGNFRDINNEDYYTGNIPGNLKMRYIKDILLKSGFHVNILSLCKAKSKYFEKAKTVIDNNTRIIYIASFGKKTKILQFLNLIIMNYQYIFYLMVKVKKDESVILYHGYLSTKIMALTKKVKKINCIIEIEEIYGYSPEGNKKNLYKEIIYLKKMDSFICVNDIIPKTLKIENQSYIISYGAYSLPKNYKKIKYNSYINVVYAGTIELIKKGSWMAIECAKWLDTKYQMHILGFGKKEVIEKLKNRIADINKESGYEKIIYHGMKKGDELTDFYHKCDIGLSCNIMKKSFVNHSFPSKVVTYMCNGLAVVVGHGESIEQSALAKNWTYFYKFDEKHVANAIKNATLNNNYQKTKILIEKLNNELIDWMKKTI